MDDQTPEEIKSQMADTRAKLADKLEILEEQLVEPATEAVAETVATVKEAIDNTSDAVKSTLKKVTETLDLSAHVRKYPWRMMGASVATGFFLGQVLKPRVPEIGPQQVPAATPVAEWDEQQNRHNGIYNGRVSTTELPADHRESASSWSNIGTSFQTVFVQSLVPICQGLFGAVLAEFFRQSKRPESLSDHITSGAQHRPPNEVKPDDEWIDPDIEREPDWGQRLRSTPR